MNYEIRASPDQLRALSAWVKTGYAMAPVELVVDNAMLVAEQGDERMAWDRSGKRADEEYLALAPLDRRPNTLAEIHKALDAEGGWGPSTVEHVRDLLLAAGFTFTDQD